MIIIESGEFDVRREENFFTLWESLGRPTSLGYSASVRGGGSQFAEVSLAGVVFSAREPSFGVVSVAGVNLRLEAGRLLGDVAGYSGTGIEARPVVETTTDTVNGFTTKRSTLRADFSSRGKPNYSSNSPAKREFYNPFPATARLRITGTADDYLNLVVFTGPVRDASGQMLNQQSGFIGGAGGDDDGYGVFIEDQGEQTGNFRTVNFECDVPQGGWFRFNVENPTGGYMGYGLDITLTAQFPKTEVVTNPVVTKSASQVAAELAIDRMVIAPPDRTGVGWWDIAPISRGGLWVKQLGAIDKTGRFRHDAGRGTSPAVVVYKSATQPVARAATNAQFGPAQFAARDWVVADSTQVPQPRDLTDSVISILTIADDGGAPGKPPDTAWILFASAAAQPPTDPPLTPTGAASGEEELNVAIEFPDVQTYPLVRSASYPSTLARITAGLRAGTATALAKIEGDTVATLTLSSAETAVDVLAALEPGQSLDLVVSAAAGAEMLSATFKFQR